MYHDISTVLQRTDEIRCAEGAVYDEWNSVLMGYSSHAFEVEHVAVGIAESLGINHLRIWLDGCIEGFEVIYINNSVRDPV